MKTKCYEGLLTIHSCGENDDALFLSSVKDPLAEELEWIRDKRVTVRYWITDKQVTKVEAQKEFLRQIMGVADARYFDNYSEITGYLWTDEDLNVGGHDLMFELRSNIGKWLILEIDTP